MNATDVANLEAEFRRRAIEDNDSTWRLAAALLITAAAQSQPAAVPLMTSKELGPLIGLSWKVVHEWKASGVIPAAIDEPGCLRFDLAAVRAALAKRAAKKSAETAAA